MVRMMIRMIVRHLILSTRHYQISPSYCGHLILPFDIICPFAIVDFWYPHAIGDIWYFLVIIICPRRLKRGWAPIGGTFDIFQAMSFVPETMVWFGHSRGVWSGLDHSRGVWSGFDTREAYGLVCITREVYGLVLTLERRMVWFGSLERCMVWFWHSRGVWSGLDTREMYEVAWIYCIIDGLVLFTREM